MTIDKLFVQAARIGVRIELNGDKVRLNGPQDAVATLRPIVVERKADVIAWLKSQVITFVPSPPPAPIDPADLALLHWLTDWLVHPALDDQGQVEHEGKIYTIAFSVRQIALGLKTEAKREVSMQVLRSFYRACMEGRWRSISASWPHWFDRAPAIAGAPPQRIDIAPPRLASVVVVRGNGRMHYWKTANEPLPGWATEFKAGIAGGWLPVPGEWWNLNSEI